MKYRALQPFIAFGKAPQPGELVDLTPEQAKALYEEKLITGYELKVMPRPENKAVPKSSGSARVAPVSTRKTSKRSKKTATKS